MKDLSFIPAPTRSEHQSRISNIFRLIHERSAKTLFGLTGAAIVLPMVAEAQVSPVMVNIDDVSSIREYEVQADGSIRATLNNGQKVLITQSNVVVAANGTLMISELAAEELLLASDSAYGMIGVSTGEGIAVAAGGLLGLAGLGGSGSNLLTKVLKIIDAPLQDALVFYDSNVDGEANQAEFLGYSDATGSINVSYEPVAGGTFIIIPTSAIPETAATDAEIAAGALDWDQAFIDSHDGKQTIDTASENIFTQIMTAADAGADAADQVVSPISTLVQKFVETGASADAAEAEASVKELLGIDEAVDLATFDFAEALESEDAGEVDNAKDVLHKATAIANAVETALAVAEAQGEDDGEGGTQALEGEAVVSAADEILGAMVKTMAAVKESVDSEDAGSLGAAPSFDDLLKAATAVAVADVLGGEEGSDNDVNVEAVADALVAGLEDGDDVDVASGEAIQDETDLSDTEVDVVDQLGDKVVEASVAVEGEIADAASIDDLDGDDGYDAAEDALISDINAIINEELLGIDLQEDAKSGVENQVGFIKGNLLQNDKYTNDLSLDSDTELHSVNGKLIPEFLDTSADQGAFILSTSDWNTPERTVSATLLNDELDSEVNPADLMSAFPTARQTGGSATAGSMIYTTITVTEDDVADGAATLSFDYNFGSYDYLPYNDYSFFAVHAEEGGTADEQTGLILRGVSDADGGTADVRDLKGTGLYTDAGIFQSLDGNADVAVGTNSASYSYEFTEAGQYKIGIGITDVRDTIVDSVMSVANITLTASNGVDTTVLTDADFNQIGNVQVDGGMVESVNVALIQGTFGNLIITKSGDYLYEVTPENSANIEDIPDGVTVTEDFSYTVKTLVDGVEQFATSKLTVTITGTEFDPTITISEDAILGVDADNVNASTEESFSVSGEIENVPDDATVTVTISDGVNPDIVTENISILEDAEGDGTWQLNDVDVSGLDDGDLSITAAIVPDGAGDTDNQTVTVIKDTDADVDDDFAISYTPGENGTVDVEVSGLDADASAFITFTAGDTVLTQGVEANGVFELDLSEMDGSQAVTATYDIFDDAGNQIEDQAGASFFAPEFSASINGGVNAANASSVTITLESEAEGGEITALSVTDGTNTVNLAGLLNASVVISDGTVEVSGANLSSLSDGELTITATLSATINDVGVTTDTTGTADKDTDADVDGEDASVSIAFASEDVDETVVNVTVSGLDADVDPTDVTIVFSDGTTTLDPVNFDAEGAATVDLATMAANKAISSTVTITDDAGNTHSLSGAAVSFGTVPTVSVDAIDVVNAAAVGAVEITGSTTNASTGGTVELTVSDGVTEIVLDPVVDVQSDGSFSATMDLSSLQDGTISVTAVATVGSTDSEMSETVQFELDTTADEGGDVAVTLTDDIDDLFDTEVTASITGLDADASAELTFSDGSTEISGTFANGTVTLDLSSLDTSLTIISTVTLTDDAGNTEDVAGPEVTFNLAPIYNVDQDESYSADELQDALDAANAGDTIQLAAGEITGDATITTSVNLVGAYNGEQAANAADLASIDIEGRDDESVLTGTITVAAANVSIDGVKLDNDTPLVWDTSILTGDSASGFGGELDGFSLKNSVMTTYDGAAAPTLGSPEGGSASSYSGPTLATNWDISGNLIGGVTSGNSGALYLAGLEDSSISGNVFIRPTAGHLYMSSLTNTDITDNFFYHGVHAGGVDLDGNGAFFDDIGGYGYGYGYGVNNDASQEAKDAFLGRNFWMEIKGTNTDVTIDGNDGKYNSGGIQLYGESGDEVFDGITITNNSFSDFINADPLNALGDEKSGFMGAIAVSVTDENAQASDLEISGNTITVARDQIFDDSDLASLVYVVGGLTDGDDADDASVSISNNTIEIVETSAQEILDAQAGTSSNEDIVAAVFIGQGIEDQLSITGNTIFEGVSDDGGVVGLFLYTTYLDLVDGDSPYGNFYEGMTGNIQITGNTFDGFPEGLSNDPPHYANDVVVWGLDLEAQYNDTSISEADVNVIVPYANLDTTSVTPVVSIDALAVNLVVGTSASDVLDVEAGNHAVLTAGGSDTVNLGNGISYVALDGMATNGDVVTITNFNTAEAVDASFEPSNKGEIDGVVLYNLNADDLRADGGYDMQLVGDGDTIADPYSGLLVFTTEMDFGGDAAAAIEAAVEGMSGIGNGETLFAIGRDGEDAALVRVEIDAVGEHTTTQIADIDLQAGGTFDNLGDSLNGFVVNFTLPEVG